MRKTNILFATDNVQLGGGETSLLALIDSLDRNIFKPMVLCSSKGPLTQKLIEKEVEVIVTKPWKIRRFLKIFIYMTPLTLIRLFQILKRNKVHIVHIYSCSILYFLGAAAHLAGIPIVYTCHSWERPKYKLHAKLHDIFLNLFVDKIICVCSKVRNSLESSGIIRREKLDTIYLAVDLSKFDSNISGQRIRQEFNIAPQAPVIGFIGRFQPVKGHKYFLEAVREVIKSISDLKCLIVGEQLFYKGGDGTYRQEIKDISNKLGLYNNVIFTGFRQDIPEILATIDLFVSASLLESFGVVLIETMAMRKPVIATNIGGPTDIVENNRTGFLVPPGDAAALAKAIISLLNDKMKMKKMGFLGRKRVERHFDLRRRTAKIEKIYHTLLYEIGR